MKPDSMLIAEELNPEGDVRAKESNYGAIIGNSCGCCHVEKDRRTFY